MSGGKLVVNARKGEFLSRAGMALLIAVFFIAAIIRNGVWRDEYRLSADSIVKSPLKARPYLNLGLFYFREGLTDEAIRQYLGSLALWPDYPYARNNLGVAYHKNGFIDEAIAEFKEAIRLYPGYGEAHYNLGVAYGDKGLMDEAYGEMRKGIELNKNLIQELK